MHYRFDPMKGISKFDSIKASLAQDTAYELI